MKNPDEYKIEVIMKPHPWDNEKEPYFWCILGWYSDTWCNNGCGWSVSPEQAWKDANVYYNKMILRKQKENDNEFEAREVIRLIEDGIDLNRKC